MRSCPRILALALTAALCTHADARAQSTANTPENQADTREEPAPTVDPAHDKAQTSGLAIGTGAGSDNVFFGGHVAYYVQLPSPKWRIAAHAGMGVMPLYAPEVGWGARGGAFAAYGLRHRLVLGVYGGTMEWYEYGLHGVSLGLSPAYGFGVGAGWEWMHEGGLYLRASVGPGLAFTPDAGLRERRHDWVWRGNFFAIGYKIW